MRRWITMAGVGLFGLAIFLGLGPAVGTGQTGPNCGEVLFEDDFSDPESGWLAQSLDGVQWSYTEAERYQAKISDTNVFFWSWAPASDAEQAALTDLPDNFCLTVDARQLTADSHVGLAFGGTSGDTFLRLDDDRIATFFISGSFFKVERTDFTQGPGFEQSEYEIYVDWTESQAITNGFNTLTMVVRNLEIRFFINDTRVETIAGVDASGTVGVEAGTFDGSPLDMIGRFDNFTIRRLP